MLESAQTPNSEGVSVLNTSQVSRDLRHTFGCAHPTRGSVCDCGAVPGSSWRAHIDPDQIRDHVGEDLA
jgi:hypothetical protein